MSLFLYIPRDESDPTNDVLGNPLTNTGRRPNDAALHSSNCLTADGTLYIAAAHLAGTETVVSSGGTSTPSISAGRIDFTAGTCWDLTLSDGTHYKLAEGYGTLILDASGSGNHGVLTNATLGSAWGGSQDEYHSNLIDGSGKRMLFDKINDYVNFGSVGNLGVNCRVQFDFSTRSSSQLIFSQRDANSSCVLYQLAFSNTISFYNSNGNIPIWIGTPNGIDIRDAKKHTLLFIKTGNDLSITIDGYTVSATKAFADSGNTGDFAVGGHPNELGKFEGVISNVKVDAGNTGTWDLESNGYGNTDSDWIDITGNGNDGTVVGSPKAFYIPAAPDGLDVFGNELTEKPSDATRNRAETLIDLDPDSTPEMNNIYLESVFNGSTSNGYVTNDSVLNFTDNLTVSCWAKSDLTNITSQADTLVSMFEDTGNLEVWRMEISTGEKLRFQVGNSGGTGATIETADSAYPIDTWTHYAATFDGGVVKLYINGELQSSSESSAHATSLNGRSAPLILGAFYWTGGGGSFQEWDGSLRNIRVYKGDSSPLSNSQIVRDMIETRSQPRFEGQTVIASYDLVKDTLDRSGNSLNAQNNNISFTKKTVPASLDIGTDLGEDGVVQKTVKFDSGEWGAVFDGSSYMIVKNREKLKIKEKPFSIECSVKTSDTGSNTILSKYQTSGNLRSYSLNIESGKIVFHSSSNGTAVVSSTGSDTINDGSWHKIKVVRESESGTSLKMYVDDVEDTGVGGSLASNFSENISNVAIGAYNTDATAANVFTGNIRELKVFTDDNIERASWELAKDTRDVSSNNYHGENNGITFLTPKQEYGYSVSNSTPLGKQDQYLKEYHKSRLYL